MVASFKPRAYLKEGCPFSFKFLLFMTEAGLLDQIRIVRVDAEGPEFERIKKELGKGLGKSATFPAAEIQPGKYLAETDRLIEHFSSVGGIEKRSSATMSFYTDTILPQVVKLHELEQKD